MIRRTIYRLQMISVVPIHREWVGELLDTGGPEKYLLEGWPLHLGLEERDG